MGHVFIDLGDVQNEGCRYKPFTKWWINHFSANKTRGVYLFAEPYDDTKVEIFYNAEETIIVLKNVNSLILSFLINLKCK